LATLTFLNFVWLISDPVVAVIRRGASRACVGGRTRDRHGSEGRCKDRLLLLMDPVGCRSFQVPQAPMEVLEREVRPLVETHEFENQLALFVHLECQHVQAKDK
jgi:hypothetical protein